MTRLPIAQDMIVEILREAAPRGVGRAEILSRTGIHHETFSSAMKRASELCLVFIRKGRSSRALYFANGIDASRATEDDIGAATARKFTPASAPQQFAIIGAIKACGLGATMNQIRKATGQTPRTAAANMKRMRDVGRVFSTGPNGFKRYFVDEAYMLSVAAEVAAEHAAERAAKAVERKELHRMLDRARHQRLVASRPPKPAKAVNTKEPKEPKEPKAAKSAKAANLRKPPKLQKAALTALSARTEPKSTPKQHGHVIIPPHVRPQIIPGFSRDRFEVTEAPPMFSLVGIGRDIRTGKAWGES